jgi:hypothetical protein
MSVMPSGLLKWGQAGVYDAVDDREVITALIAGNQGLDAEGNGIVKAPTFTAGNALNLTIGPWLAAVAVGDGSVAIIGTRQSTSVVLNAGPASGGPRTDVLWADIDPDGATWQYAWITTGQITGRPGIEVGRVGAPNNANLATQFTLTPRALTFGRWYADTFGRSTQRISNAAGGPGTVLAGLEVGPLPVGKFEIIVRGLLVGAGSLNTGQGVGLFLTGGTAGQVRIFWNGFPRGQPGSFTASNFNGFGQWNEINMAGATNHVMVLMQGMFNLTAPATLLSVRGRSQGSPAQPWDAWPGWQLIVTAVPPTPSS